MKNILMTFALLASFSLSGIRAKAHCEIPCGIFDDSVRIALIYEHIVTIEKSMTMINKLQADEKLDYNQMVRWITNKEEHANKIQELVAQYFMHQRVKIVDEAEKDKFAIYVDQLTSLHEISVYAMKAKQSTDALYIKKMRESVHNFEHAYFANHSH